MRLLAATLAVSLLIAPQAVRAADALSFGTLLTRSTIGQPFAATFTIDAGSASASAKLEVRLADVEAYAARRADRDAELSQLRFEVAARKGRIATIRVTSAGPIRGPLLELLIEARSGTKTALHEYAVLLDPPAGTFATPAPSSPTAGSAEVAGAEFGYELDLYYTNVSVEIPLTDQPMPNGGWLSEREVYRRLFKESLRPQLLLLEASVYPMPVLGTHIKEHSPETYDNFTIGGGDLNLLDGLTAGFQEPWAISAFVGSGMKFSRDDKKNKGVNKGYMGYLASFGAKHIHQNVLIDDDWWEVEWKLKGERSFEDEDLTWSFRLGFKTHGNPEIADTLYFGSRRTNLDYKTSWLGWLNNSSFEWLTELSRDNLSFLRQDLVIGKRFPSKDHKWAFALDVGLVYEKDSKYTGSLFDPDADDLTIVFRPNIVF
jgi:hypothetical protein